MKKEFTTALLGYATGLLPSGWETYELIKKSRSALIFRKPPECPEGLYNFVCIYPSNKWEEIDAYLGWTKNGSEPSPVISDPRALDFRGAEYELDDFRTSLGRATGDWTKHYAIVRPDCSLEELEILTLPMEIDQARRLVEPCILKIREDLEKVADGNYFQWVDSMRLNPTSQP